MNFEKLFITGADLSRCELGEPMLVFDRQRLLGSLEPLGVSADRSEVHIGRFLPSPAIKGDQRGFGPLLLVEICMFLVERFPSIQAVRFTLTREIEMHGDGRMVAAARSELLRSIGATDVHILPKPDPGNPGNFVVYGYWPYTEHNIRALREALEAQRACYREQLARMGPAGKPAMRLLRRLKQWWAARG